MEKIQNLFKSPNFQKYASIALLLIILAIIPITLSQVSSPKTTQTISQHAASGNFNQNICGVNIINSDVSPQCHLLTAPQGNSCNIISTATNTTNGSYKTQITFRSTDSRAHTVLIAYWTFFCTNGGISPGSVCSCNSSGTGPTLQTIQVPVGSTPSVVIQRSNDSPFQGQSCGAFQYDFIVKSVDGNQSCSSGSDSNNPAGWSICQTGINCAITPPTSTPTPTSGITPPTSTPIPTDTPTPGLTVTPTDTPVPSATPTDTPTPGTTVTPTNTPSPTPTGTLTPTTPPTSTPTVPVTIIVRITPKPTLPPTGPGNTVVNIGVIGIVVAVLGVVFAIGI